MESIVQLNEVSRADVERVGGKAAHLGELITAGFNCPDGLVITTEGFTSHLREPYNAAPVERPDLSEDFAQALTDALQRTFGDQTMTFAVRSSAKGEDDDARSFAGQHDTYYFIPREEIDKAVVDCWMSVWNQHALAYRQTMNLGAPEPMAVIIQPMIRAVSSGVCFSTEPTGRFPGHGLIEATWGLGAALVDGRVSPDQFFVREQQVTHTRVVKKRFRVVANPSVDRRLDPVPTHLQAVPSLTDAQAQNIYDQSIRAAELFDAPQDVEWAIEKDELYILQSRPVTTDLGTSVDVPDGKWVLFKPLVENFHEPLTPMTADLFMGMLPALGQVINGRFYLNLDAISRLIPVQATENEIVDMVLLRSSPSSFPADWKRLSRLLLGAVSAYLATGVLWHRTAEIKAEDLTRFLPLIRKAREDHSLDARQTLKRFLYGTGYIQPISSYMFQINLSAGRYFLYIGALEQLISRAAPDFDTSKIGDLVRGDPDMYSSRMVRDLDALRDLACEYTAVRDAIEQKDPERLITEITTAPSEHPFITALQSFLERYGHRCIKEMELASPRWREDPAAVIGLLQASLSSYNKSIDTRASELAALDELHQKVSSNFARKIIDRLLERIRYNISLRENSRYYHTMIFDLARQKLKSMEQELIYTGKLKCADDIFFLVWDEAEQLQRGELSWEDVSHLISTRRRGWVSASKQYPPETLNIIRPELPEEEGRLVGQCASPGCVEGVVRIVLDPTMASDLKEGDILVAPYTDPAWTPLFPVVSAVVVGIGSFLSHAGTVAREFQIPCLVDVSACTDRLTEGTRIRVNASEGYLEIL